MKTHLSTFLKTKSKQWLYILIFTDLIFIALHILKSLDFLGHPNFSITRNFGFGETFFYLKEATAIVLLCQISYLTRAKVMYVWTALLIFIFLDDSLEIHEMAGYYIKDGLEAYFPDTSLEGLGELLFQASAGLVMISALVRYHFRCPSSYLKTASQDLFILFAILVFFGVGVDLLHSLVDLAFLKGVLGLIEDGGEMLTFSVMLWYIIVLKNTTHLKFNRTPKNTKKMVYAE